MRWCATPPESLLLARRRDWHERIGRAIEEKFPETAANDPELLAHHFGEAGLTAPACDYRERSGDRTAARSAYREAIAHYSAGLVRPGGWPTSASVGAGNWRFC